MKHAVSAGVLLSCLLLPCVQATLIVGSDGAGPVQLLANDGTPQTTFGPGNGTAGAFDSAGGLFVGIPGDTSSTIDLLGPSQDLLSSFTFTAPGDNRAEAAYITDLTWGAGGTLWVSTFTGKVYHLASDGTVLSSFDTGTSAPGVAFDGTSLYTTSGPGFLMASPFIYQRDLSGAVTQTINSGLNDTLGVAYDPGTGTLWVGGFDVLSNLNLNGAVLQTVQLAGTHFGVEEGTLSTPVSSVPEPAAWTLLLIGFFLVALRGFQARRCRWYAAAALASVALLVPAAKAAVAVTALTPNPVGPQPVGTLVTFTATASDTNAGALRYRFRVRPAGGAWSLVRDYSPATSLAWTAVDNDGMYEIEVSVVNRTTSSTQSLSTLYTFSARTSGSNPAVNPTSHPLVALYSAPACPAGSNVRVRFKRPSDPYWQTTPLKPCNGNTTVNFYVAGMRASSEYQLRQDVISGPHIISGPILSFTTGSLHASVPATDAILPLQAPSSMTEGVVLFGGLNVLGFNAYAVDSGLQVIWYATTTNQLYLTRPVAGGGYGIIYGFTQDLANSGVREYDLLGNLVKETNVERMNDQLLARGMHPITTFHHEFRKLPNGHFMALAMTERMSSAQGPLQDIAGDMVLVLDSDLQLLWAWDSFDHLDVSRRPTLGDTCALTVAGCVLFNATSAVDWLHGNLAAMAPDGNIVYSARSQDFVYKIAYENGSGDGHVIWKLGKGGDFTYLSNDPYPWFSHQHEFEYEDATTASVFDNGNTRVQAHGGNSRGQAIKLDEVNKTATLLLNADLGGYSLALGSAQRLLNGDYVYGNNWIGLKSNTQVSEWSGSGSEVANTHSASINYRCFRLRDLYSAP